MLTPDRLLYALDLFGTVVFAISGLLQARRLQLDVFGMLVLAAVTAIGGGTIRDLVLDVPVFWVRQPEYLWSIALTCVAALPLLRIVSRQWGFWLLLRADALGLATFTTIGASKALALGAPAIVAISMGVLTGVGGGVIRDVFAREIPMVLRKEVYATACIAGATVCVLLQTTTGQTPLAMLAGFALTLLVRLAALQWNWHLPALVRPPESQE